VHAFTSAPRTSRDDRWLTFYSGAELGRTKVYILPLHGEGEIPQSEWIEATDGSAFDVVPEFSPNGNLLYFPVTARRLAVHLGAAARAGHQAARRRAISRLPFPPRTPVPDLRAVRHGRQRGARDKVVYTSVERTGNIWMIWMMNLD